MLSMNKASEEVRLSRPEAHAFDYDRLTDSQRKAIIRILKILDDAQKELNSLRNERDYSDIFPGFISVPEKNSSRVLLLSGGRGSGKTSVLYSLLKFLHDFGGKYDGLENLDKIKEYKVNFDKGAYEKWNDFIEIFNSIKLFKLCGINEIKSKDSYAEKKDIISKGIEELSKKNDFIEEYNNVNKRFIWLQPLEMETLPSSTNLLAAILNRIDEAVSRFRGTHPKTHQSPSAYSPYQLNHNEHDAMLDFTKLQQDVALAWDGNVEMRAANMDPDHYAVEVLRAEQKRLRLNDRIRVILNELNDLFIIPYTGEKKEYLFVLPIDDFDLNPHRCLELIRLIRILNVPRLFTLILGDIWLIRTFMNFKYFQSIEDSGSNPGSTLSNIRYDECELAHNLSGGANRKLFVPANIISLKRMTIDEVYQFRQTADAKKELKKYLEDIEGIDINTAYYKEEGGKKKNVPTYCFGNIEITKQHDLFNQKVDKYIVMECEHGKESIKDRECKSENEYFYIRNEFYKLYPRLAQDICLKMDFDAVEKKIDEPDYYLTYAYRIYKARISQERGLTTGSSIFLNDILRKNFQGNLRLDISAIDLEYTYGQPLIFQKDKSSINILHPEDWYVKLTHPLKSCETPNATEEVILNEPTAAALVFIHDLLAFSDPTRIVGNNLMLKHSAPLWAYTQWPFGSDARPIKVPWHFPPWQTMFECDLLRRCWIEVWEWSNKISKFAGDDVDEKLINVLVYLWLRINTNILSKPKNCMSIYLHKQSSKKQKKEGANCQAVSLDTCQKPSKDSEWKELLSHIRVLYGCEKNQTKKREKVIYGWFTAIGCLLAPETNISEDIRKLFAVQEDIKKILIDPIIAGGIRKLRARSAVLFFNNGALNLLKDLFNPKSKAALKLNKLANNGSEIKSSSEDFINKIGKNCLCPFVEDIVMLSKLNCKKKNFYKEELIKLINTQNKKRRSSKVKH